MKTAIIVDRGKLTRTRTSDGFLRGHAAITRTGVIEYTAAELGVEDTGRPVRVLRTRDSVFSDETLSSIRGAAITLDHPTQDVRPENWKKLVVGNIVGEPAEIRGGRLGADVMIGDASAIKAVEGGVSEISIGYRFAFEAADAAEYDYISRGGLDINHVALVKQGRAGRGVRVFDSRSAELIEKQPDNMMTKDEMAAMVKSALTDALPKPDGGAPAIDVSALADKLIAGIAPVAEAVKKMAEDTAAREKKENEAAADKSAREAADKLVSATQKDERARALIIADALPLIPEKQRDEARKAEKVEDVLRLAIGDSCEVSEAASLDYLMGVFNALKKDRAGAGVKHGSEPKQVTATDKDAAYDDYIKELKDGYKNESATAAGGGK